MWTTAHAVAPRANSTTCTARSRGLSFRRTPAVNDRCAGTGGTATSASWSSTSIARLRDHLANGRTDDAKQLLTEVGEFDKPRLASIHLALGDPAKACEIAKGVADSEKNQLAPWAQLAWMQWSAGRRDEAIATFQEVRRLAGHADSDLPLLRRLAPLADLQVASTVGPARSSSASPIWASTRARSPSHSSLIRAASSHLAR